MGCLVGSGAADGVSLETQRAGEPVEPVDRARGVAEAAVRTKLEHEARGGLDAVSRVLVDGLADGLVLVLHDGVPGDHGGSFAVGNLGHLELELVTDLPGRRAEVGAHGLVGVQGDLNRLNHLVVAGQVQNLDLAGVFGRIGIRAGDQQRQQEQVQQVRLHVFLGVEGHFCIPCAHRRVNH